MPTPMATTIRARPTRIAILLMKPSSMKPSLRLGREDPELGRVVVDPEMQGNAAHVAAARRATVGKEVERAGLAGREDDVFLRAPLLAVRNAPVAPFLGNDLAGCISHREERRDRHHQLVVAEAGDGEAVAVLFDAKFRRDLSRRRADQHVEAGALGLSSLRLLAGGCQARLG